MSRKVTKTKRRRCRYRIPSPIVYVLLCPETDEIKYVGVTKHPKERKAQHTKRIKRNPVNPVDKWTNSLIVLGTPPKFVRVAQLSGKGFMERSHFIFSPQSGVRMIERCMIHRLTDIGCELLNVEHNNKHKNARRQYA